MFSRIFGKLNDLRHDEQGAETLQVLMLLAIAAVCLILIKVWGNWYFEFTRTAIEIFLEN